MELSQLFNDGSLVDIDISMWTGEKRLQPEDLGIPKDSISKTFTLGSKKLLPKEVRSKFKNIDYEARKLLVSKSVSFPFGGARFVPKKALVEFVQEIDKLQQKFQKLVDDLVANFNKYKLDIRAEYVAAAHKAYDRLKQLKGFDKTRDEYINEFLARVDSFYPKAEEVRSKYSIDYHVFQVALPDITQASYEDIVSEQKKISMMEKAFSSKINRKIEEFAANMIEEIRSKAELVLSKVTDNMARGGRISEATLRMLRQMIANYQSLNVIGDSVFENELLEFKKKYLDIYDAESIRNSKEVYKEMTTDLQKLTKMACDQSTIKALSDGYRNKVSVS